MTETTARKKAVVTGGAGFIGSHLVEALLVKGYHVSVVDSLVKGKRERVPPTATFYEYDIRDTDKLREVFAGAAYVFHLAALPEVQYSIERPLESNDVNVNGTLSVLLAARDAKVGRINFNTWRRREVYNG